MNSLVLSQDELKAITGYNSPAEIAACLSRQGIKYLVGKRNQIFTTISALELAMGVDDQTAKAEKTQKRALSRR